MFKFLFISRTRPDTEAAKYQRGKKNFSKPKVMRKFSASWEKLITFYRGGGDV